MMASAAAATHSIGWRVATGVSGSAEWGTPPAIYLALDQEFNFTLDVCASGSNAKHVRYLTKDTDALGISWAGERVYCNPPYGRHIRSWVLKARHEAREHGALVVLLVPARTGCAWFHEHALQVAEIRFIRGRLSYTLGAPGRSGRSPFDSMVLVYRPGGELPESARAQLLFPFLRRTP